MGFGIWWSWKDYDAVVVACKRGDGPAKYGIYGYAGQALARGGWIGMPPKPGKTWVETRTFRTRKAAEAWLKKNGLSSPHETYEVRAYTKADYDRDHYWRDKMLPPLP